MFRSATFKLTAWYMLIIVAITLLFSFVIYRLASDELASSLAHQSARFIDEFPAFSSNGLLRETSELNQGRREILGNLVLINIGVFITAGIASYALARRTLRPIEAAHTQQKRFTADVSHELRTPLTALHMETEVALMDKRASKTHLRQALESNLEETLKLERLINSLMRLTKLEAAELQQSFVPIAVEDIVTDALETAAAVATQRQIKLVTKKLPSVNVLGDRASLSQLCLVLLENAIKYSTAGSDVEISGSRSGDSVSIIISDHGVGIERDALQHIFDRFYRADKARTSGNTTGFGLGLSIAKQIAETHKGSVTIKSRLNHGTTAIIQLPLANKSNQASAQNKA